MHLVGFYYKNQPGKYHYTLTYVTNFNYRIVIILYNLETWFVSDTYFVNPLYNGD